MSALANAHALLAVMRRCKMSSVYYVHEYQGNIYALIKQLTSQVEFILNGQKTVVILTEVKTVIENVKLISQPFKRNAKKNVLFSLLKNGNFKLQ